VWDWHGQVLVAVALQGAGGHAPLCRYVPERQAGDERAVDGGALGVGADGAGARHGTSPDARRYSMS